MSFSSNGKTREHRTPAPIWGRRTQCPGKSGLKFKEAVPGSTASKNRTQVCVTEDHTKRAIGRRPALPRPYHSELTKHQASPVPLNLLVKHNQNC